MRPSIKLPVTFVGIGALFALLDPNAAYADRECLDPGEAEGEDAVFLASHYLRSSRPKKALKELDNALAYLGGGYQNDAAIELASRALAAAPTVKNGRIGLRVFGRNEQRSAISTVEASASGMSANSTAISARVLKR